MSHDPADTDLADRAMTMNHTLGQTASDLFQVGNSTGFLSVEIPAGKLVSSALSAAATHLERRILGYITANLNVTAGGIFSHRMLTRRSMYSGRTM